MITQKLGIYFYRLFLPLILLVNLVVALGITFGDLSTVSNVDLLNTYFGFTSFMNFVNDLDVLGDTGNTLLVAFKTLTKVSGLNFVGLTSSIWTPAFWENLGYFVSISLTQPLLLLLIVTEFGFILIGFILNFFVCFTRLLNGYYNLPIEHVIDFPPLVSNLYNTLNVTLVNLG